QTQLDFYRKTLSPAERARFDDALAGGRTDIHTLPFLPNADDPAGTGSITLPALSGAPAPPNVAMAQFDTGGLDLAPTGIEYWSGAADARPVIELVVSSGPGDAVPTSISLTLTVNGTAQTPRTFTIGGGYSSGQD